MNRTRIVGLCLIAMCAAFAFSASSAFAVEPGALEFGKCTKVEIPNGTYKNAGCTVLAKAAPEEHKFNWEPLTGKIVRFESKKKAETTEAVLEGASTVEIACAEQFQGRKKPTGLEAGEYGPGKTEIKNVIGEFKKCKGLGANCNSEGAGESNINTFKLHGEPGIITKAANEVKNIDGSDLRGELVNTETGEKLLAKFSCGGIPVLVRGGVVVKAPTNKMLSKVVVSFLAEKFAKQVPEKWTPLGSGVSNSKKKRTNQRVPRR